MKFKKILDPKGQIVSAEMIAETSGPCIVVFPRDSVFLYSVIKWTANVTRVWVKMLSLLQILS